MDIATTTRSARSSRRQDLLLCQWERKRYEQHRRRVKSAKARIDFKEPVSQSFQHVRVKPKKLQLEDERCFTIMKDNLILLRHLTDIANRKLAYHVKTGANMAPTSAKTSNLKDGINQPDREQEQADPDDMLLKDEVTGPAKAKPKATKSTCSSLYYDVILGMRQMQLDQMRGLVSAEDRRPAGPSQHGDNGTFRGANY